MGLGGSDEVVLLVIVVLAVAGVASAARSEHGNITLSTFGLAGAGLHDATLLINGIYPGSIPNGLYYYEIRGVVSGGAFTIKADDGQEPFVVGTAGTCPGPDTFDPTDPDWWLSDFWVYCQNHPDFDVYCGGYPSLPGDEKGTVDCSTLYVYLSFGDLGEGFTYTEE